MSTGKVEFKELLEASGWSQSEAARRLHLDKGTVSQYCSNKTRPSRSILELFKLILASERPDALGPVLRETSPRYHAGGDDVELWKRRAKAAEADLADIKDGLRELLARPSSKVKSLASDIEHEERGKLHKK